MTSAGCLVPGKAC